MADDDDVAVAAAWYFLETSERNADKVEVKHKRRYYRRYWIHDVLRARQELGEYHRLVHELRSDPQRFRRYFRMSTSQFDEHFHASMRFIYTNDSGLEILT